MDKPVEFYWKIKINRIVKALERNNFEVFTAPDRQGAHAIVMDRILPTLDAATLSWGGSMTFTATGLYETLKAHSDFQILDTFDKAQSREDILERRRQALLADVFITGTNAITEDGKLYNADMIGNRVAALAFGPKHVIVLAGRNKIAADHQEAFARIKSYAAPANALRLDKNTPCAKTGRCHDCTSPERICNIFTVTAKSFPKARIKVVLINEDLGL